MKEPKIAIAATFTAEPLRTSITFWIRKLRLPAKVEFAPYNQVIQQLLDPSSVLSTNEGGANVILVRFEDWVHPKLIAREKTSVSAIIDQNIRELMLALRSATSRSTVPYLVCICPDAPGQVGASRGAPREKMESLLFAELAGMNNVHAITAMELATTYPVSDYYDGYADELGHIPYTPLFFTSLGTMIARKLYSIKGTPFKVIALDCDQTLWKGVCGEEGTFGIEVDASRKALQKFMVEQHDSGMLICLCSKNNEEDVLDVFAHRIEMPLKREHIISWRINWDAKSKNIISLAEELQVGLDSFIFIDDNPVECAEVQSSCPEVLTLQLPQEAGDIPRFLQHVWAFDHLKVTEEDKKRTILYRENFSRQRFEAGCLSLGEFLAALELKVDISEMALDQVARVAQLTQRTNQFNATTVRYSEEQIQNIYESSESHCLVATVSDRFGDYGVVGVIIFENDFIALKVDTVLLSCRVLGRGVEHRLIARLGEVASELGLGRVEIPYIPTRKNRPMLMFLESIGTPLSQLLDTGYLFRFPTEFAKQLTYSVETIGPRMAGNDKKEHSRPGQISGVIGGDGNKSIGLRKIVDELYDAELILKEIESYKQKPRPTLESAFVKPRNPSEKMLADMWAKLLGISGAGVLDNFFELGGDSLLAVELLTEVDKVTGKKLGAGALFHAPTIEQLAKILQQEQWSAPWASLVPIQPNGFKPPFFFVSGSGNHFGDHLGPEQPVYRLQIQDLDRERPFTRAEDMAAHCIKDMRALQPEGPYFLGGHCFGGVVAFEIAQQVKREGQEVALLALFETDAPGSESALSDTRFANRLWLRVYFHWNGLLRNGLKPKSSQLLRLVKKKSRRMLWRRSSTIGLTDPKAANYRASRKYQARVYPGAITLFRCAERPPWAHNDTQMGWGSLASGGVEVYDLPGSHTGMYKGPHVSTLIEKLGACLHQAQAKVSNDRTSIAGIQSHLIGSGNL